MPWENKQTGEKIPMSPSWRGEDPNNWRFRPDPPPPQQTPFTIGMPPAGARRPYSPRNWQPSNSGPTFSHMDNSGLYVKLAILGVLLMFIIGNGRPILTATIGRTAAGRALIHRIWARQDAFNAYAQKARADFAVKSRQAIASGEASYAAEQREKRLRRLHQRSATNPN